MCDCVYVCSGKALSNLYDLIRPLRAKSLGVLKHIIILYPHDFPLAVWQRISIFESIWIVRGSALEEADIRRCGIFRAKQVVLLADSTAVKNVGQLSQAAMAGMDALTDADIIFSYQAVRRMNENAHVVVEIVRPSNVGYLDPESGLNSSDIDYKFTPQFASGALFATSLLDTFVCQAFYNTKIVDIIQRMVTGVEIENSDKQLQRTQSANSKGAMYGGRSGQNMKALIGSSLYQIPLPEGLGSRTYGALYSKLAERKMIPLGLLRGVFSHTNSGPKSNKMPYVFTNPPKDTELFSCDKVFVLSQQPVKLSKVVKDDSKDLQIYTALRMRKKTAEDVLNVVNTLRGEVSQYIVGQELVKQHMAALDADLKFNVNGLISAIENFKGQRRLGDTGSSFSRRNSNTNGDIVLPQPQHLNSPQTARKSMINIGGLNSRRTTAISSSKRTTFVGENGSSVPTSQISTTKTDRKSYRQRTISC
jgi:hypothetical protein